MDLQPAPSSTRLRLEVAKRFSIRSSVFTGFHPRDPNQPCEHFQLHGYFSNCSLEWSAGSARSLRLPDSFPGKDWPGEPENG
jgi:hypothetical protein